MHVLDHELLDVGDGARLERFGAHIVDRPHAGALAPRRAPARWVEADLRFDRDRGWSGPGLDDARAGWPVRLGDIEMRLHPTEAGQVGFFPEHVERLDWLVGQVRDRAAAEGPVEVLNLFAYTGLVTLALAGCGATVTHVDAARPSVAWARENAAANGMEERPIRWIVDDARAYARREARRGRSYDGIVLDPPSYGHGASGSPWRIAEDLPGLLDTCADLLRDDGFILVTAHTEGLGPARLGAALRAAIGDSSRMGSARGGSARGETATGDVALVAASGATLSLGAFALVSRRS